MIESLQENMNWCDIIDIGSDRMKYLGSKTIETDRLILKTQTMNEQKYLWSVLMLPEVNRYYLTVPKKYAEKLLDWNKQEKYYLADMEYANDLDVFKWSVFIKETGECIGRVSCHEAHDEDETIDNPNIRGVGWYIDPAYKGNGYGTEAAIAMMDYMFNECDIDEIKTGAAIANPASWKIMEKFGFVRTDKLKLVEYTFVNKPVEDYQYYLTKKMYLSNKYNKSLKQCKK